MTHRSMTTAGGVGAAAFLAAGAWAGEWTWTDETPATQDPVAQFGLRVAAAPDDALYALWSDISDFEDVRIHLTRSVDGGETWSASALIFDGVPYQEYAIAADADGVHVLLVDFEEQQQERKRLYHAVSTDGGDTFTTPVQVGERENVEGIRVFTGLGRLFVHAVNLGSVENGIPFENYLYVSDDAGASWTEKPLLPGLTVQHPAFALRDGVIHMAYGGFLVTPDIMYTRSADLGDSWLPPVAASQGAGVHSQLPRIAVDDEAVHVAWEDDRTDDYNVFYTRSTDGGASFGPDEQLNDTYYGARVKLIDHGDRLHMAWVQYHGDNGWPGTWSSGDAGIIWYKSSDDSGATWSEEFRVSQNEDIPPIDLPSRGANHVWLAPTSAGVHAAWLDKRDGNVDLYVRNALLAVAPCAADLDGDDAVSSTDLRQLLGGWGGAATDITGDGVTDIEDLLLLLALWGACA